ncbi:hypothetical protein [Dysgonomonas sp.]|uniref:hypothetical protein n=1 Tax=Dysgonomonas sp. TaxID=1891233 RepID=UPI0027B8B934|nr:hypothetical protein [Dysgonomonas sp.]
MPTIKIPFPIHQGLEVKNATIDIENGYTVVEYGEKEKKYQKGEILFCTHHGLSESIVIADDSIFSCRIEVIAQVFMSTKYLFYGDYTSFKTARKATESERKIIFDALSEDRKKWNEDTKKVEPIQ